MLSPEIIKKIEEFVYKKPRTIQEIAQNMQKSWRTADRYIENIEKNFGTITTRVFRQGTRGALKIAYWSSIEKVSSSAFQEELEERIMQGKSLHDFPGLDIFQHVPENKRNAWIKKGKNEVECGRLKEFEDILMKAKKQILFFSGNLSFINYNDGKVNVFKVLEKLAKKGINMKVICNVDIRGIQNIEKLLSLNFKYGKEIIEVRHREQPLRATVIDDHLVNIKEQKKPTGREKELKEHLFIFYTIKDKEWVEWLSRIFWKFFSSSILAEKRLQTMQKIES